MLLDGEKITINSTPTIDPSLFENPSVAELSGTLTFTDNGYYSSPVTLEDCKLYLTKTSLYVSGEYITVYGINIRFPYGQDYYGSSLYNTRNGWVGSPEITLNEITSSDMKTHRMVQFLMENSDYEPVRYSTNETELYAIANAIREKGGTTAELSFPDGFISAIESIQTASE